MVEVLLWYAIIFTGGCGALVVVLKVWWWVSDKIDDYNWKHFGGGRYDGM